MVHTRARAENLLLCLSWGRTAHLLLPYHKGLEPCNFMLNPWDLFLALLSLQYMPHTTIPKLLQVLRHPSLVMFISYNSVCYISVIPLLSKIGRLAENELETFWLFPKLPHTIVFKFWPMNACLEIRKDRECKMCGGLKGAWDRKQRGTEITRIWEQQERVWIRKDKDWAKHKAMYREGNPQGNQGNVAKETNKLTQPHHLINNLNQLKRHEKPTLKIPNKIT